MRVKFDTSSTRTGVTLRAVIMLPVCRLPSPSWP
jgi:hypothetical protein